MKPVYRRTYERYARAHQLSSHGRRRLRREIATKDRAIRRACERFVGQELKPETIAHIKDAIRAALNEARL
ncbi:hypothetical protein [Burkholderia anthina]|uniref:hypothetical protein n=1 Tax=Burkholderia anthina TaxID=179879 RepID=UPI00158870FB|nr:hypothetical protein [Burkholderia anthina]